MAERKEMNQVAELMSANQKLDRILAAVESIAKSLAAIAETSRQKSIVPTYAEAIAEDVIRARYTTPVAMPGDGVVK